MSKKGMKDAKYVEDLFLEKSKNKQAEATNLTLALLGLAVVFPSSVTQGFWNWVFR